MDYLLITDNIITNIIVCADDATAASFGAVPSYDGARIGDPYDPPRLLTRSPPWMIGYLPWKPQRLTRRMWTN